MNPLPWGTVSLSPQEQCFQLIQQLFKAAGCLPDKGSLDLEIWEKVEQRIPHNQESLDKKRRD